MLSTSQIRKLTSFIGYGPKKPKVVFLGIEEGLGGREELTDREVAVRARFEPTEDLCAACKKLGVDWQCSRVVVWNTAARFALALAGLDPDAVNARWREYRYDRLGRNHGEAFLMECFPVPRRGLSHRLPGYSRKSVWCDRRKLLRQFLRSAKPPYVVAYGKPAANLVMDLLDLDGGRAMEERRRLRGAGIARVRVGSASTVVASVGFFGRNFGKVDIPRVATAMMDLGSGPLRIPGFCK
jgi:hypothetical protein